MSDDHPLVPYVFWSERLGRMTSYDATSPEEAHAIASCLSDEWETDDVQYDIGEPE